jgi:hypothetical protein
MVHMKPVFGHELFLTLRVHVLQSLQQQKLLSSLRRHSRWASHAEEVAGYSPETGNTCPLQEQVGKIGFLRATSVISVSPI